MLHKKKHKHTQLDLVVMMENWRMRVLKMDTEGSADNSALATEYGVRALPTILWIAADGSVLQRAEGAYLCVRCARARAHACRWLWLCVYARGRRCRV